MVINRRDHAPMVVLTVLAGALYTWGLSRGEPHGYYSAAITSMSESWFNFFFGAFDPSGAITTDKLPGSLWVHALFARVFGTESWALLLPEVLAATLTVPLLMAAVRRWAGGRAALIAGLAMLASPVVFTAAQVNLPDTLLMFTLVAATYAMVRALDGGWPWLVASGALIAVAFHMKMLQAWMIVPALGLTYLLCAKGSTRTRWLGATLFGGVALVLSLSWMTIVSLIPAGSRPLVDGSESSSIWETVFLYNGISRGGDNEMTSIVLQFGGAPGVGRMFNQQIATQVSWLIPLALLALAGGLFMSRNRSRQYLSGWVLWGSWLVIGLIAFSALTGVHPYYTSMLAPAVAALVGTGIARAHAAWRARRPGGWLLPAGLAVTALWSIVLLFREPADDLAWLPAVIAVAAVLALTFLIPQRISDARPLALAVTGLGLVTLLLAPAIWLLATPTINENSSRTISPVAGPPSYQSLRGERTRDGQDELLLKFLRTHHRGERFLFATGASSAAAPYIRARVSVLPLSGFSSTAPSVPVAELAHLVADRQVRYVLAMTQSTTGPARERTEWLRGHCAPINPAIYGGPPRVGPWSSTLYDCRAS
ncbi:4-amino-4-deoxy-L-arabinose transferase-like glycosyltransferase [Herbihabitans rhizosphaerae]|uniref:4-amino-4-deoxy-L-arabinose transferase-like glycosyltransferase n=1 Tax=Herbihabitans rhizosphaerae TaxID=1872711 RepID=A0A4Q7KFP5_9PSEU|nr:glycosyltransferase family 39 protein [Herbihabitans rhizosphaerae]RZS32723.1 4-amino-4-deoxy-L-arabinose transferase-like glycosyltransferase [Herbihabitans rhizosphaerae]